MTAYPPTTGRSADTEPLAAPLLGPPAPPAGRDAGAGGPRHGGRGARAGRRWAGAALLALALVVTACGDDGEPGPTIEELLAGVEGRELSATEVSAKLALGDAICRLDEPILDAMWLRLDEDQLEFQDVVFGHLCPERAVLYASHTGRYVTEEAEGSGVVPSTLRPSSTTSTTPTDTSTRATIGPGSSTTDPGGTTAPSGTIGSDTTGGGDGTTGSVTTAGATTGLATSSTPSPLGSSTNPGEGG